MLKIIRKLLLILFIMIIQVKGLQLLTVSCSFHHFQDQFSYGVQLKSRSISIGSVQSTEKNLSEQYILMQGVNQQHLLQETNKFVSLMKELQVSKQWKIKDEKPFQKAQMEIGDRLVCRGKIKLNLPFETVFQFLANPAYIKIVAQITRNYDLIYDANGLKVVRFVMAPPGPVSNREIVAVHVAKLEGNKAYCGNRSCNFPIKKYEDTIIAEAQATGYIVQKIDEKTTLVTQISYMDIKGSIPNFIKNATAGTPTFGLPKLQEKIKGYKK